MFSFSTPLSSSVNFNSNLKVNYPKLYCHIKSIRYIIRTVKGENEL